MTPQKTRILFDSFPTLYRGRHLPVKESLMSMGFMCKDGWFDLIYELSLKITNLACINNITVEESENYPLVSQVKEKFGQLRYYIEWNPQSPIESELNQLIDEYEKKSLTVCEDCGKEGFLDESSQWWMTKCQDCWNSFSTALELLQRNKQ